MYAHDCQQFLEVSERLHKSFVAICSYAYLYTMLDGKIFNRETGVGIVLYLIIGPVTLTAPLSTSVGVVKKSVLLAEALQFMLFVHN
jgi:hypothetical protein